MMVPVIRLSHLALETRYPAAVPMDRQMEGSGPASAYRHRQMMDLKRWTKRLLGNVAGTPADIIQLDFHRLQIVECQARSRCSIDERKPSEKTGGASNYLLANGLTSHAPCTLSGFRVRQQRC
jgi:hypothetical protein